MAGLTHRSANRHTVPLISVLRKLGGGVTEKLQQSETAVSDRRIVLKPKARNHLRHASRGRHRARIPPRATKRRASVWSAATGRRFRAGPTGRPGRAAQQRIESVRPRLDIRRRQVACRKAVTSHRTPNASRDRHAVCVHHKPAPRGGEPALAADFCGTRQNAQSQNNNAAIS